MGNTQNKTQKILEGEIPTSSSKELRPLIAELKRELQLGLAHELLAKERDADPANVWIVQQLALCTHKDEELLPTPVLQ